MISFLCKSDGLYKLEVLREKLFEKKMGSYKIYLMLSFFCHE
jgi:hypothetical protein